MHGTVDQRESRILINLPMRYQGWWSTCDTEQCLDYISVCRLGNYFLSRLSRNSQFGKIKNHFTEFLEQMWTACMSLTNSDYSWSACLDRLILYLLLMNLTNSDCSWVSAKMFFMSVVRWHFYLPQLAKIAASDDKFNEAHETESCIVSGVTSSRGVIIKCFGVTWN